MPDYRKSPAFAAAVSAVEAGIDSLAAHGVADAIALAQRAAGRNNLQGHYHTLVPFAVLVLRKNPQLLAHLKTRTHLQVDMGVDRAEARSVATWGPVAAAAAALIAAEPRSQIANRLSGGVADVGEAANYLSQNFGGVQGRGGGGDTVLKRTLKLVAHLVAG